MQEIEVKILEIDRVAVEQHLRSLGATISFDGEMHALFFDDAAGKFTRQGDVLRLRKEGESIVLAYKKHLSREGAKVMEETEVTVDHFERMRHILTALGLSPIKETQKHRREFQLGEAHVAIDDYQGALASIPVFMEIEAPSLEAVHGLMARLGLPPETANTWSTYELVVHYGLEAQT